MYVSWCMYVHVRKIKQGKAKRKQLKWGDDRSCDLERARVNDGMAEFTFQWMCSISSLLAIFDSTNSLEKR